MKYMPISTRAASIWFVLASLHSMNVMYHFSLKWFYGVFGKVISDTMEKLKMKKSSESHGNNSNNNININNDKITVKNNENNNASSSLPSSSSSLNERLSQTFNDDVIEALTSRTHRYISEGLFSEHQLPFSFLLCISIMLSLEQPETAPASSSSTPTSSSSSSPSSSSSATTATGRKLESLNPEIWKTFVSSQYLIRMSKRRNLALTLQKSKEGREAARAMRGGGDSKHRRNEEKNCCISQFEGKKGFDNQLEGSG